MDEYVLLLELGLLLGDEEAVEELKKVLCVL